MKRQRERLEANKEHDQEEMNNKNENYNKDEM
jgi:hypothetical protein